MIRYEGKKENYVFAYESIEEAANDGIIPINLKYFPLWMKAKKGDWIVTSNNFVVMCLYSCTMRKRNNRRTYFHKFIKLRSESLYTYRDNISPYFRFGSLFIPHKSICYHINFIFTDELKLIVKEWFFKYSKISFGSLVYELSLKGKSSHLAIFIVKRLIVSSEFWEYLMDNRTFLEKLKDMGVTYELLGDKMVQIFSSNGYLMDENGEYITNRKGDPISYSKEMVDLIKKLIDINVMYDAAKQIGGKGLTPFEEIGGEMGVIPTSPSIKILPSKQKELTSNISPEAIEAIEANVEELDNEKELKEVWR